jgi:hypothetical protein
MERLSCPPEEDWGVFLLTTGPDRGHDLIEHLARCQMCNVTLRQREKVLGMLEEATHESANSAQVISPFRVMPDTLHNGVRLVAAQSKVMPEARSLSMVSTDQAILVKVVEDEQTRDSWLYVISDNTNLYKNVLVRPLGDEREFLTDENGRVNLGAISVSSIDPGKAEVVLPTATFKLVPITGDPEALGDTTLRSEFGDEIRVSMYDTGSARRIKVDILRLSHRATERPIRIAVRDTQTGRSLMLSPSESIPDILLGPSSAEIYIFQ